MGQAQINVRIRACSRTSIARTKQAALTHNVRGKELRGADCGVLGLLYNIFGNISKIVKTSPLISLHFRDAPISITYHVTLGASSSFIAYLMLYYT